jgi:hypothetical protein
MDYRKPLSRQQVDALRSRIADLEGLLRTHGILVEPIPDGGNDGNAGHSGSGKEEAISGSSMVERGGGTDRPGPGSRAEPRARAAFVVSVGMDGADVLQRAQPASEDQDKAAIDSDHAHGHDDWPNSHLVRSDLFSIGFHLHRSRPALPIMKTVH